jgi:hypothetical protein
VSPEDVVILLRVENDLAANALVAENVVVKLLYTSGSASFRPLVMRYFISFRTGWFKDSYEGYRSYSD